MDVQGPWVQCHVTFRTGEKWNLFQFTTKVAFHIPFLHISLCSMHVTNKECFSIHKLNNTLQGGSQVLLGILFLILMKLSSQTRILRFTSCFVSTLAPVYKNGFFSWFMQFSAIFTNSSRQKFQSHGLSRGQTSGFQQQFQLNLLGLPPPVPESEALFGFQEQFQQNGLFCDRKLKFEAPRAKLLISVFGPWWPESWIRVTPATDNLPPTVYIDISTTRN